VGISASGGQFDSRCTTHGTLLRDATQVTVTLARAITESKGLARVIAAALGLGAFLTVLGVLVEAEGVAARTLVTHAVLETVVSLIGLLACFLLLGRFWVSRTLGDLLLAAALFALVSANVCFGVAPAVAGHSPGTFATWAHAGGRVLAAAGLAAAAFVPETKVPDPRRAVALMLVACLLTIAAVAAAVALVDPGTPGSIGSRGARDVVSAPALLLIHGVGALAFLVAALGLALRALRREDELMAWFSAGAVLAAFAYLNYAIFPSIYSSWVHIGDLLRIAFYVVLLLGALREIDRNRREASEALQLAERQRLSRDLHDGLTQDLAFLAGRLQDLRVSARSRGEEEAGLLAMLSEGAQRALDEARAVTASFASTPRTQLAEALKRTAEEVANREGGRAKVCIQPGLEVSDDVQEALTRIVREGVTNAVRHGGGARHRRRATDPPSERSKLTNVEVTLIAHDGLELVIKDDGRGFQGDPAGGFGVQSIRQRAAAHGGSVSAESKLGEGAVVTVRLPRNVVRDGDTAELEPVRIGGSGGQSENER
jgi:signal transduction histidine kinase